MAVPRCLVKRLIILRPWTVLSILDASNPFPVGATAEKKIHPHGAGAIPAIATTNLNEEGNPVSETKPEYWVQIEKDNDGSIETSAVQIDLNRVERVQLIREKGKLSGVRVRYSSEVLELPLRAATSFMDKWERYKSIQEADEPDSYGLIEIPKNPLQFQHALNPKLGR